jgi:hypothetical protein
MWNFGRGANSRLSQQRNPDTHKERCERCPLTTRPTRHIWCPIIGSAKNLLKVMLLMEPKRQFQRFTWPNDLKYIVTRRQLRSLQLTWGWWPGNNEIMFWSPSPQPPKRITILIHRWRTWVYKYSLNHAYDKTQQNTGCTSIHLPCTFCSQNKPQKY